MVRSKPGLTGPRVVSLLASLSGNSLFGVLLAVVSLIFIEIIIIVVISLEIMIKF